MKSDSVNTCGWILGPVETRIKAPSSQEIMMLGGIGSDKMVNEDEGFLVDCEDLQNRHVIDSLSDAFHSAVSIMRVMFFHYCCRCNRLTLLPYSCKCITVSKCS